MSRLALARKWRPKQFSDVVGQAVIVQALTNALNQQLLHHAYLFTGTRGVGKTTLARILAKCFNCDIGVTATPCGVCAHCVAIDRGAFPDLFEIDAASRTKVEDTRELLDNIPYAPTVGRFKIYLIDEVHMLSGHSFNALLKTLEEPPAHVVFILATTDPQKLPATILSRCLQFHLSHVPVAEIQQRLQYILEQEQVTFDLEALRLLSEAAQGSVRDALSLLDQSIAFGAGAVLLEATHQLLGTIDTDLIFKLLTALSMQDANAVLETTQMLAAQGAHFGAALAELLRALHDIALAQFCQNTRTSAKKFSALAAQFDPEDVQLYYQIGLIGQRDLVYAPTLQNGFEMTLLRMLAFTPNGGSLALQLKPEAALAPAPIAAPVPQQRDCKADPGHESVDFSSWQAIFQALTLTGTARLLAEQCVLISISKEKLELGLHPKYKPLMQQVALQRLREAVIAHVKHPIALSVTLMDHEQVAPADTARQKIEKKQQQAEESVYNDSKVQQIIKKFDAKIIKESIKPTGEQYE